MNRLRKFTDKALLVEVKRRNLDLSILDDLEEISERYVDELGGVGYTSSKFEFVYRLGKLPRGWPKQEGVIHWFPSGPHEGTFPKIVAYGDDSVPRSVLEGGCQNGYGELFGEIVISEEKGITPVYLTILHGHSGQCDFGSKDCDYGNPSFATLAEAHDRLVEQINLHLGDECETCRNNRIAEAAAEAEYEKTRAP